MAHVKNFEIARLFYEIAALLDARQESRFRIRAYQRAAQTLETLSEDITVVAARGGRVGHARPSTWHARSPRRSWRS